MCNASGKQDTIAGRIPLDMQDTIRAQHFQHYGIPLNHHKGQLTPCQFAANLGSHTTKAADNVVVRKPVNYAFHTTPPPCMMDVIL